MVLGAVLKPARSFTRWLSALHTHTPTRHVLVTVTVLRHSNYVRSNYVRSNYVLVTVTVY